MSSVNCFEIPLVELRPHGSCEMSRETSVENLIAELNSVSPYPDSPRSVELIETHISWVFLTDRYVYKVKKPVAFDFLDFSTLAAREQACRDELRLNRRLAGDVYLDVVPITHDQRGVRVGDGGAVDSGEAIDWAVKMRRLPADRALDRVLKEGKLTESHVHSLEDVLISFYKQLPSVEMLPERYLQRLENHIRDNRRELLQLDAVSDVRVRRIHAAQLRLLRLNERMFRQRVKDGRIVEGHGDLRPEHVYLTSPPAIIDCIEFSQELRQIDVADELSFLAMECDVLDAGDLGQRLVKTYQRRCGDALPAELLSFYKCYRACVRAKVLLLRSQQLESDERDRLVRDAVQYLELADRYALQLGPPHVLVVGGLMGTGKSTVAQAVAEAMGSEYLQTDAVRRELFGDGQSQQDYGQGHYAPHARQAVYQEMHRQAEFLLRRGLSVVLDGTYLKNDQRRSAVQLANSSGAAPLVVLCRCDDAIVMKRLALRSRAGQSLSDGRPELYLHQKKDLEALPQDLPAAEIDTSAAINEVLPQILQSLAASLAETMEKSDNSSF